MNSVSIAVLNFNGVLHLKSLLPTLRVACEAVPIPASVVLLDNQSTGADIEWVTENHPWVRSISADRNEFLYSYNSLLPRLTDDIVVILNNDIRVDANFLAPLLRHFRAADVFSVSARSFDWSGCATTSGPARLICKSGFYDWSFDTARQELCHTLFTSGGSMAVDRRKFVELGGFNRLYYPAYSEDLDLCFRAWRRGWRCIYEPASVVYHRDKASWGKNEEGAKVNLGLCSGFLFQWASLPVDRIRVQRLITTLRILLGKTLRRDYQWPRMWLAAALRWMKWKRACRWMKTTDAELRSLLQRIDEPITSSDSDTGFKH